MSRPAPTLPVVALAGTLLMTALPALALDASPRVVDLGAQASDLAGSIDGTLVAVGTADGVFGFRASGDQVFHALAGTAVTAVGVDRTGALVVAGDANGVVHFLRGSDGFPLATALVQGAVSAVDVDRSGGTVAVGTAIGWVYSFDPADATPPFVPDLPVGLPVLPPQWSYNTQDPVKDTYATPDGRFVLAGTDRYSMAWSWQDQPHLSPGGTTAGDPFLCVSPPQPLPHEAGPNCWYSRQWSQGSVVLAGSRGTYDVLVSFGTGWNLGEKANFFSYTWAFKADAPATASVYADSGSHAGVGDSLGGVHYIDNTPADPPHAKQPRWSWDLGSAVAAVAMSGDGRWYAAGSEEGTIALFDGPAGRTPVWTYDAGAAAAGLVLTPSGNLVGAAGDRALFWY